MIISCQVADYWSLHLLDSDWLSYTDHWQVLTDRQRAQILPIDLYRSATDEQFDR